MTFGAPIFLSGLLALPLVVYGFLLLERRKARYAIRFTNVDLLVPLVRQASTRRRHLPRGLFLLALASLVLGLARPYATVLLPREEATIVLALDSSASMQATDIVPNRLRAMKHAAKAFLDQLPPKFQIGVVAFSDGAQVLTQPTTDRIAVRDAIASLRAGGLTAIGDAIATSVTLDPRQRAADDPSPATLPSIPPPEGPPLAAVLLLSDGANTAGQVQPMVAAARAKTMRLPVFTIALGPPEEMAEQSLQLGVDPPDYDTLRAIAQTTSGKYFNAPSEQDLQEIYQNLASRLGFVKDRQEVTFAFAAIGALLAAAGAFLSVLWAGRFP